MSEPQFSISGNLVFRGVIIGMFTIILGLVGTIGSMFLAHLASIDASIQTLNVEYGREIYRIIRLETKLGIEPAPGLKEPTP